MPQPLALGKHSIGVGDRFAREAEAQLRACMLAQQAGVEIIPVWNKSNREHAIIHSEPAGTRAAADKAVRELGWSKPYFVDADHIGLTTVERFLPYSDFFTIDVADFIGQPAEQDSVIAFIDRHPELACPIELPRTKTRLSNTKHEIERIARKFLLSVQEAGRVYRHIVSRKGQGTFVTEVSMDETDNPQTPSELLIILAAISDEHIPLQTIAPKFTGRFNKGVDYVGEVGRFEKEFNEDLAVLEFAVSKYALPANLKLSVHSGSDKFSIYAAINRALTRFKAGLHLKTAGTTWLEEVIGLAEDGGDGLVLAKDIYANARARMDELCAPYRAVIDIDARRLPAAAEVARWTSEEFVGALRHIPSNPKFNPDLRQLLHVGYKIAANMGTSYLEALKRHEVAVARNVTENLFERHFKPVFLSPIS